MSTPQVQFEPTQADVPYGHWVALTPTAVAILRQIGRDPASIDRLADERTAQLGLLEHMAAWQADAFEPVSVSHRGHREHSGIGRSAQWRDPAGRLHAYTALAVLGPQAGLPGAHAGHLIETLSSEAGLSTFTVTPLRRGGFSGATQAMRYLVRFVPAFTRAVRGALQRSDGMDGSDVTESAVAIGVQAGMRAGHAGMRPGTERGVTAIGHVILSAIAVASFAIEGFLARFHKMTSALSVWNTSDLDLEYALTYTADGTHWLNVRQPEDRGQWFALPGRIRRHGVPLAQGPCDAVASAEFAMANATAAAGHTAQPIQYGLSIRRAGADRPLCCLIFDVPLAGLNRMDAVEGDGSAACFEQARLRAPAALSVVRHFWVDGLPLEVRMGTNALDGDTRLDGLEGPNYTVGVTLSQPRHQLIHRLSGQALTVDELGHAQARPADAADPRQQWCVLPCADGPLTLINVHTRRVLHGARQGLGVRLSLLPSSDAHHHPPWRLHPLDGAHADGP